MTISSPDDRKKIRQALQEASNSLVKIEAERDLIKDIAKQICEDFEIPRKHVRKMIRVYHKQNFQEEMESAEEFEQLYEEIVHLKSGG